MLEARNFELDPPVFDSPPPDCLVKFERETDSAIATALMRVLYRAGGRDIRPQA